MKMRREVRVKLLRARRFLGRIWERIFKTNDMTPEQKRGLKIFEETIALKDVNIFVSPLSDTIYVYVNDIYLVIEDHHLKVINGMYNHEFQYEDKGRSKMRNKVFYILEKRREKLDAKIKSKSDKTLDCILGDIRDIRQKEA
jgi:hypothetical protein